MKNPLKQSMKTTIAIALLSGSIFLIYAKQNLQSQVATVTQDNAAIKYVAGSKITEVSNNEGEDDKNTKEFEESESSIFKLNDEMKLELIDKANPYNIDGVSTKILEDDMMISFSKPEDKGTNYDYIINNNGKEKKLHFYAKSEVKGYNYIIDSNKLGESLEEINKLDDSPIVLQNLNWEKDYYLHFRTFDGEGNFSENKTFKLDLPSDGVNISYIDISTNEDIASAQSITGVANAKYNANDMSKELDGYKLLNIKGELEGVLKKDKINIIYEYAKKSRIKVNYIDSEEGKQLRDSTTFEGYEGEQITINAEEIDGYTCDRRTRTETIQANETEINVYYQAIPKGTVNVKYIDSDTNTEIADTVEITNYINTNYSSESKEIEGYELNQSPDNETGIIEEGTKDVIYYYRCKGNINMNDNNKEETIIDELINSLDEELIEDTEKNSKVVTSKKLAPGVKAEYEIVMNCDSSDYFIYYKK